jgi:bacterioferritin-associated ferredoxin
MSPDERAAYAIAATALAYAGKLDLDPYVSDCPKCGGHLRTEIREQRRPIARVASLFGVTEKAVRATPGISVDAFGQVEVAVPYGTCMECGTDYDMTEYPSGANA